MIVRAEADTDRDAALEVERRAFGPGQEGGTGDDIVAAIEAIRSEDDAFALVAEEGGEILGHVQFSRAWIGDAAVMLLGPIGVRPDRQREGIGSALVRAGLDEARRRGEPAVILLGDPRFYGRFGFVPGSTLGLRNPAVGVQPDGFVIREEDFMVAPLDAGAQSLTGRVRWTSAL